MTINEAKNIFIPFVNDFEVITQTGIFMTPKEYEAMKVIADAMEEKDTGCSPDCELCNLVI